MNLAIHSKFLSFLVAFIHVALALKFARLPTRPFAWICLSPCNSGSLAGQAIAATPV
jgi:hypothetical protein